jgi:Xaa-Pro dipeptidase
LPPYSTETELIPRIAPSLVVRLSTVDSVVRARIRERIVNGIGEISPKQALASIRNNRAAVEPIAEAEFAARRHLVQRLMREVGLDAILLTASPSLRYFTGAAWQMLERLTGAILPREGLPTMIVPAFEEPRLRSSVPPSFEFRTWQEDESPYALCAATLRDRGVVTGRIAIDEQAPYFVVDGLAKAAPQTHIENAAKVVGRCRIAKSAAEIAIMKHAMQTTLEVQRLAAASLCESVSTGDVVAFLNAAHVAAGSDLGSTFAIVAFGESTAYPHGPEQPQKLRAGDLVLVDTGCTFHGYHADLTRTYVFGKPTQRQREIWETERDAHQAAFSAIRRGGPCSQPDDAARGILEGHGYGPDYETPGLPHRTGHGIGLEIHEPPYLVRGNAMPFEVGMCASIEPMLCLYGEMGVRLEDHFYVADDGPQWFTKPSTNLDDPFGG